MISWLCLAAVAHAGSWQSALASMPLITPAAELNRTNLAPVLLPAFHANPVVKALILMPGATDEFYFFKRATAKLTNSSPTLLDAVQALASQTRLQATFRPPFLLLHTDEDPLDPKFTIQDADAAQKLRERRFLKHVAYDDKDWDFLLPILTRNLHGQFLPLPRSQDSWHFFRHSFAAWNLTGWEALEAISLAGKTTFTVERTRVWGRPKVTFEGDLRVGAAPTVPDRR